MSDEAPDAFEEPSETYGEETSDASEDALGAFEEALGTSGEASEESEDAPEASEKKGLMSPGARNLEWQTNQAGVNSPDRLCRNSDVCNHIHLPRHFLQLHLTRCNIMARIKKPDQVIQKDLIVKMGSDTSLSTLV